MQPRVALATCAALPRLADDEQPLLAALHKRGVVAEPAVWDQRSLDWSIYDLVVVRSTWDYTARRERFLGWAQALPRVLNPAEVVRWNTDKRYLSELPRALATQFIEPAQRWLPPSGEYVIKPAVSAGARDTARYGPGDEDRARAHVDRLLAAGRVAMLQPYVSTVDLRGETALVYLAGEYSHAICKGQMLARDESPTRKLYAEEVIGAREPSSEERTAAEEVLDSLRWPREQLLYARVDLVAGPRGEPQLLELELTEPSLFLSHAAGAAARFAERIAERL